MSTDIFKAKLGDKLIVYVRTPTGRFYDVTHCEPIVNGHIDDSNGVLVGAKPVSAEYVADRLAECNDEEYQHFKIQAKAKVQRSKIRRVRKFRKEAAV